MEERDRDGAVHGGCCVVRSRWHRAARGCGVDRRSGAGGGRRRVRPAAPSASAGPIIGPVGSVETKGIAELSGPKWTRHRARRQPLVRRAVGSEHDRADDARRRRSPHFGSGRDRASRGASRSAPTANALVHHPPGATSIGRITPSGVHHPCSPASSHQRHRGASPPVPDGNLWFTNSGGTGSAASRRPAQSRLFATSGPNSLPEDIVAGSDGALWFDGSPDPVRAAASTTAGQILGRRPAVLTHFDDLAAGPDGNLWVDQPRRPTRSLGSRPPGS